MFNFLLSLSVIILLGISSSHAKDPIELEMTQLNTFMQNSVRGFYPIVIPVPKDYIAVDPEFDKSRYAFWMKPNDAKYFLKTDNFPKYNGHMYGKISTNVGYDQAKDFFIGVEEPDAIRKMEEHFSDIAMERVQVGTHAILLMKMLSKGENRIWIYAMYIATNIATNVLFVAYRPPNNSQMIGDFVWDRLKKELKKSDALLTDNQKKKP